MFDFYRENGNFSEKNVIRKSWSAKKMSVPQTRRQVSATDLDYHYFGEGAFLPISVIGGTCLGCSPKVYAYGCLSYLAVIGIVAWSLDVLGNDATLNWPSWCWISPNVMVVNILFWQYMTGKAWEIVCYFLTAVLYALIKCTLQKQVGHRSSMLICYLPRTKEKQ